MVALPVGTRLGPYEILALIGVGGMGEVHKTCGAEVGPRDAKKYVNAKKYVKQ